MIVSLVPLPVFEGQIVFTAVAVPIMILIEKDGVKPMPSVTSFSASAENSNAPPMVYVVETDH